MWPNGWTDGQCYTWDIWSWHLIYPDPTKSYKIFQMNANTCISSTNIYSHFQHTSQNYIWMLTTCSLYTECKWCTAMQNIKSHLLQQRKHWQIFTHGLRCKTKHNYNVTEIIFFVLSFSGSAVFLYSLKQEWQEKNKTSQNVPLYVCVSFVLSGVL